MSNNLLTIVAGTDGGVRQGVVSVYLDPMSDYTFQISAFACIPVTHLPLQKVCANQVYQF